VPRTPLQAVVFLIALWTTLVVLAPLVRADDGADPALARLEAALHDAVNEVRRREGLIPLQRDAVVTNRGDRVARAHSRDMAARGYFAHETPEGLTPPDRLARGGVGGNRHRHPDRTRPRPLEAALHDASTGAPARGERGPRGPGPQPGHGGARLLRPRDARGAHQRRGRERGPHQPDPNQEIVAGWLTSPVHRQNLLAPMFNVAHGVGIARVPARADVQPRRRRHRARRRRHALLHAALRHRAALTRSPAIRVRRGESAGGRDRQGRKVVAIWRSSQ
jgi:hypothetical protein